MGTDRSGKQWRARDGRRPVWAAGAVALVCASAVLAAPAAQVAAATARKSAQEPLPNDEVERLRLMLAAPGADGRESRDRAIERLLSMPTAEAHRLLQSVFESDVDPDGVRLAILAALQGHLLGHDRALFGAAPAAARRAIVAGYVAALARFFRDPQPPAEDRLGAAVRTALRRMPPRELEDALRELLAAGGADSRVALCRCIADLQQLHLSQLLAEHLDATDSAVRDAARHSLRLLTFHAEEFTSRAQFQAWFAAHHDVRYIDLAERAARRVPELARRDRAELAQLRIETSVEVVRAYTTRTPGFDWTAIQARTLVEDGAVLDSCLQVLQRVLADGLPADNPGGARQTFCRALLQRWRLVPADQLVRRSLLLEVAAYTARPEETELVTELVALLLTQLDAATIDEQLAALRGLRCFPTGETRARILRYAHALLPAASAGEVRLATALATLSCRAAPRWYAPAANDADKSQWLELVRGVCAADSFAELRDAGLTLALSLDSRDQRVPEVFDILLAIANDTARDIKFRSACVLHLRGWRDQPGSAERWVQALHSLLADNAPEIRQLAAESLPTLTESVDPRKREWISSTIAVLRERLRIEPSVAVLRALVDSLQECGREPQMPEQAIGALHSVLLDLGTQVPPEHQFRLEPLLLALAKLAGDSAAAGGQWLGACAPLLQHEKRRSLRLVLQTHAAVNLAEHVASTDAAKADPARRAMQVLIKTALLKPAKEGWKSTEELQREARDVRVAFTALDSLGEAQRLDEPQHRVLRLEVELASNRFQEVVQRATAWLANGTSGPGPGAGMTPAQRDRMRCLAAEAQLELGKADAAAKLMAEREPDQLADGLVLDLMARIARGLFAADATGSIELFERVVKGTPMEDPGFRARLMEWAGARAKHDPASRAAVWSDVEKYAQMFDAQDCPTELRDAFYGLRGQR